MCVVLNDSLQADSFGAPLPAQTGRKKFKELRQKLQTDDEDVQVANVTPPNSRTSSIDGLYATSTRTTHPFRVIEHDSISLQSYNSLIKSGKITGVLDEGKVNGYYMFCFNFLNKGVIL